jgi:hypothetical protein
MAPPRKADVLYQQKQAKQKKLLFIMVPVFIGLLAWQGPKMYKAFTGGSEVPPESAPAVTTPLPGTEAPTPTVPSEPGVLPDTDLPPEADIDELISFSRFTGKDPFARPTGATSESSGTSGGTSGGTSDGGGGSGDPEDPTTAVIEVNGSNETVSISSAFPANDPTFTLDELTESGAVIGLVQGMFEDGSSTVEIALGERVVLVSAPDSTRYTVELISIS